MSLPWKLYSDLHSHKALQVHCDARSMSESTPVDTPSTEYNSTAFFPAPALLSFFFPLPIPLLSCHACIYWNCSPLEHIREQPYNRPWLPVLQWYIRATVTWWPGAELLHPLGACLLIFRWLQETLYLNGSMSASDSVQWLKLALSRPSFILSQQPSLNGRRHEQENQDGMLEPFIFGHRLGNLPATSLDNRCSMLAR